MPDQAPLVGIIMGSRSDWETMRHAAETLDALGVAHETKVVSAHRTPDRLYDYAKGAAGRGLKVIVAGAGGAAHLPGMAASMTRLPVLGVPVETKALAGLDSLLSIAQMPAGIPVGTLAIGKAGAVNAGLLAAAILATSRRGARRPARSLAQGADRQRRRKAGMIVPPGSTIGIVGGGQLGRMLALAAAQLGYRCHVYAPDADSVAGRGRGRIHAGRVRRRGRADPVRRRGRRRHLRVREHPDGAASRARRNRAGSIRRSTRWRPPRTGSSEKEFVQRHGGRPAPFARGRRQSGARRRARARSAPRPSSRPAASAMTARARCGSTRRARPRAPGTTCAARPASSKPWSGSTPNSRSCSAAAATARWSHGRRRATATRAASSSPRACPPAPELRRRGRRRAKTLARRVADALDHVGVLAMEFFALGGEAVFNEMAPRVHNSGHWTIEGARTSQFENHIRAICGLPARRDRSRRAPRRDGESGRRRRGPLGRDPRRPRRPPPPLRQEGRPPRPQDGPRHAAAR